jgi:hypothetical protein
MPRRSRISEKRGSLSCRCPSLLIMRLAALSLILLLTLVFSSPPAYAQRGGNIDLGQLLGGLGALAGGVGGGGGVKAGGDPACTHRCPAGQTLQKREGFKPYSNGCGSYGMQFQASFGITECCNVHGELISSCHRPCFDHHSSPLFLSPLGYECFLDPFAHVYLFVKKSRLLLPRMRCGS